MKYTSKLHKSSKLTRVDERNKEDDLRGGDIRTPRNNHLDQETVGQELNVFWQHCV